MFHSNDKIQSNSFKVDTSDKEIDSKDPIWLNHMTVHLLTIWAILFSVIAVMVLLLISNY